MLTGVSFKFKDKRIDKYLKDNDYSNYVIYYSPIKSWFFGLSLIALTLLPVSIFITSNILVFTLVAFYFFIGYLITSYYNNSFVILENQLIIINRNFPFLRFKMYNFNDINEVEINEGKGVLIKLVSGLFMIFGSNYVVIKTHFNTNRKYYCVNLDVDCYDENWTEKNLDDFSNDLKNRHLKVNMKI